MRGPPAQQVAVCRSVSLLHKMLETAAPCNLWRPPAYSSPPFLQGIDAAIKAGLQPKYGIDKCVNLAPSHTGTTSLAMNMKHLSNLTHHLHRLNFSHHYARGKRCFIMTLRDPALRLRSAYAFDRQAHSPGLEVHLLSKERNTTSPSSLVREMRKASQGRLPLRDECVRDKWNRADCLVEVHNGSNFYNALWRKPHRESVMDLDRIYGGNQAFVSQIDYLIGIDTLPQSAGPAEASEKNLSDVELHIICTRRFSGDWTALLARLRVADDRHKQLTTYNVHGQRPSNRNASWLSMGADDEAYVRECMFPDDTLLERRLCGQSLDSPSPPP